MTAVQVRVRVAASAQPGPQTALVSCPVEDVAYGGARGGGKTFGLLLDWVSHAQRWGKHARGILFRRSYPELEEVERKCHELLPLVGFEYNVSRRTWTHTVTGASLKLRYLDQDEDAERYQGHEYTWMAFDEATNWPSVAPIDRLWAALRSGEGVACVRRMTANPGGPGHNWFKARYIDTAPPYKVHERTITAGSKQFTLHSVFIPAKLEDNPALMRNDPDYEARLYASGPDWLVKAWRYGLWDIVAGGFFDDVWRRDVHVLRPFAVPDSWYVNRSFDWGDSKPFSVGWWAEADGTRAPNGVIYPRGTLFRVAEWYGWNGKPNEGSRLTSRDIAEGIIERESSEPFYEINVGGRVRVGPADPSIFSKEDSHCIADEFRKYGVPWEPADASPGSRAIRWQQLRTRLKEALKSRPEEPAIFVFDTCTQFARTVPVLQRDVRKFNDIDTKQEDHVADETGYRLLHKVQRFRRRKVEYAA